MRLFVLLLTSTLHIHTLAHTSFASVTSQHNQELWMVPASLNKLITSWLAWQTLGPDYTYKTNLKHCGNSHYHIVMTYDPTFSIEKMTAMLEKISHNQAFTLGIQSVPLTEPNHPDWLNEDTPSDYNHALSPWPLHDKSGTLSLYQIKKLSPNLMHVYHEKEPLNCKIVSYHRSMPVKQLLFKGLIESHNPTLDALWLTIAEHIEPHSSSTWSYAQNSILRWSQQHQPSLFNEIKMVDGSGLSRKNMMTSQAMLDFLEKMKFDKPYFAWLRANLPYSGQTGTLKKRFKEQHHFPIIAKTGGMSGIRNIAGWIITPQDQKSFVWLETNPKKTSDDETILSYLSKALQSDIEA